MDNSERMLPQVLGHVKDVRAVLSMDTGAKYRAYIQGHVWKTRQFGKVIFLDVTDGTGAIQVVCEKDKLKDDDWTLVKDIRKGTHLDVQGTVGVTSKGFVSVFAEHVSKRLLPSCSYGDRRETNDSAIAEEMMGLFMLSRVRRVLQDHLRALNYDEIETPLLYRTTKAESPLCPIVRFNGIGPGFPVVPSPAPLLRRAVLGGMHEVFAFSRIYSPDLRIGDKSYENFVLCVRKADPVELEMPRLGEELIKVVLTNFRTSPREITYPPDWARRETPWKIQSKSLEQVQVPLDTPAILQEEQVKKDDIINLFWLYWPSNLCLGEGHTELIDGMVKVGGIILYLDVIIKIILRKENIYLHRAALNGYTLSVGKV
jgi:lysyl-tRNA synthetase class II